MRLICLLSVTAVLNSYTSVAQIASEDAREASVTYLMNDEWAGFEKEAGTGRKGVLTSVNDNGKVQVIANYKHKHLHGLWESWYENGQACDSGSMINNIPNGEWKTWFRNGQLRAIRNYDSKKLAYIKNEIRLMHPKRSFYGLTEIARINKQEAFSYFDPFNSFNDINDKSNLQAQTLKQKVDHNTNGQSEEYLPPFPECLQDGLSMNYDSNGFLIDSGYYKNGLKEGIWIEWDADKSIRSTGYYRKGQKADVWKYYKEGKFLYHRTFRKNRH
jgi:antitoxin component YwqK of YwqJK toxin-antitoxin module